MLVSQPSISADGNTIAFMHTDYDTSQFGHVYVAQLTDSTTNVTPHH